MANYLGFITPTPPVAIRVGAATAVGTTTPTPPSAIRVGAIKAAGEFRSALTTASGSGSGNNPGISIPTTGQIFPNPSFGGGY